MHRTQFSLHLNSPMVTSYASIIQYGNQETDIGAVLLARPQTLLSFHHYLYEPIHILCVYMFYVIFPMDCVTTRKVRIQNCSITIKELFMLPFYICTTPPSPSPNPVLVTW